MKFSSSTCTICMNLEEWIPFPPLSGELILPCSLTCSAQLQGLGKASAVTERITELLRLEKPYSISKSSLTAPYLVTSPEH